VQLVGPVQLLAVLSFVLHLGPWAAALGHAWYLAEGARYYVVLTAVSMGLSL
jgi:hypothetical protein